MEHREIFNQGADLRLTAQRLVESAAAGDEQLITQYAQEAHHAAEQILTQVELEMPTFVRPNPVSDADERERVAMEMLEQYHVCRTNVAIQTAIWNRITERNGPHSEAARKASDQLQQAKGELLAVETTILELMGVDS